MSALIPRGEAMDALIVKAADTRPGRMGDHLADLITDAFDVDAAVERAAAQMRALDLEVHHACPAGPHWTGDKAALRPIVRAALGRDA